MKTKSKTALMCLLIISFFTGCKQPSEINSDIKFNLKKIGLAMHAFHYDDNKKVIPKDLKEGNPYEWAFSYFNNEHFDFSPSSWQEVYSEESRYLFFFEADQLWSTVSDSSTPLLATFVNVNNTSDLGGGAYLVLTGDGRVIEVPIDNPLIIKFSFSESRHFDIYQYISEQL